MSMNPIDHIVSILKAFDIEPKALDRVVESYLRRHREISSGSRRLIMDAVFGVVRWRRRLEGMLSVRGVKQKDARLLAVCYILWKKPAGFEKLHLDEFENEIGKNFDDITGEKFPACAAGAASARRSPNGEAAFYSFPDFLYRRFIEIYGKDGAVEIATALNEPATPVLRVNTLRASREDAVGMLADEGITAEPTAMSPFGLKLLSRVNLYACAAYKRGVIEVQDESSQLSVLTAAPCAGETVLDACAGAGGKTLMMAMLMQNKGKIIAADPSEAKISELKKRAARAGVSIAEVFETRALKKKDDLKGKFDLVFLDAPCSGVGTIRRSPDIKWRLSPELIERHVEDETRIIHEYAQWVRPGGRLAYATCSILPEENEAIVENLVSGGEFENVSPPFKADPRYGNWDGFFTAILKRKK